MSLIVCQRLVLMLPVLVLLNAFEQETAEYSVTEAIF